MSPYLLLQERYRDEPWKLLVACILLNQTTGKQVRDMIIGLFERYPTPRKMALANLYELKRLLRPLGLQNRRANALRLFSRGFFSGRLYADCYGIGQYAIDSHRIFVEGDLGVRPFDKVLKKYLKWRRKPCSD